MANYFPYALLTNSMLSNSENPALQHQIINELHEHSSLMQQLFSQNSSIQERLRSMCVDLSSLQQLQGDPGAVPCKQQLYDSLHLSRPFDIALQLLGAFPNPICKGKYFSFSVRLLGSIPETEQVALTLQLYSAENPPRPISVNMNGKKILKGNVKAMLRYNPELATHTASFKIQVNEVTSHFRNGWVFLMALPDYEHEYLVRTGLCLKPLVIEHLVSKAKEVTCSRWRAKGKVRDIKPDVDI